ncbi:MAG: hypothetical protein CHACPFDD_00371 [Phycisphaerae bacterium]|nr:hypothetical protein [Phycisphaerae bacterium]
MSGTLRECFIHLDWARDKLLAIAATLTDSQLDQRFEMGPGTLRATLHHLWAAEHIWLERWKGVPRPPLRELEPGETVASLTQRFRDTAAQRAQYLASVGDAGERQRITYTNIRGETYTYPLGDLMLHVCNHGTHHRAQAVNMLRRLGAPLPKPGLDYIFMRLEMGETAAAPALEVDTLCEYFRYGDWAMARVFDAAEKLDDDALDRPFEIGCGSIRANLLHVRAAEEWWYTNWTRGSGENFPAPPPGTPIASVRRDFSETAARRSAYFEKLSDTDLPRIVEAIPRPGVRRAFPLGCTMLQLCHHGTHHRAQTLNMLRQAGGQSPPLDYALWLREA